MNESFYIEKFRKVSERWSTVWRLSSFIGEIYLYKYLSMNKYK